MPGMLNVEALMRGKVAWEKLDCTFYGHMNPTAGDAGDARAMVDHYLEVGAAAGLAPNPWFDEAFYLAEYPDVAQMVREGRYRCGFEHYCQSGFADRAPHWLFDPAFYGRENPGLTPEVLERAGFANLYDHFLKFGQSEGRRAHRLFDAHHYLAALPDDAADAARVLGPFQHFLGMRWEESDLREPATSPDFDPGWYRATHPGVAAAIEAGTWQGALHHYLMEGIRQGLAPRPMIKIHVERPRLQQGVAQEPMIGHLDIVGWAAANHRVVSVEVLVDGVLLGRAQHGIRTEGISAVFPELTHSLFAGFHFIGGATLSSGRHRVEVIARGETGLERSETFEIELEALPKSDGPWSLRHRVYHSETRAKLERLVAARLAPVFVVVLGPTGGDEPALQRTLRSLGRQTYPHWRLHDDPALAQEGALPADAWLIKLDAGDELGVDAMLELALHRLTDPRCDFVYSDELRLDPGSSTIEPWFKPDWSPDLLLTMNYVGRLWTVSAVIAARAGLGPEVLALSGDYDAVLRLTEHASRIGHVPRVLCASRAPTPEEPLADRAALEAAMLRRGIAGTVEPGRVAWSWHVRRPAPAALLVSVIIPTAGTCGLIETCLRSLRATTDRARVEVIVIDTAPDTGPTGWRDTVHLLADRVVEDRRPFNWSRVNNQGAQRATGDVLLFLNDDIVCTEAGWLEAMLAQACRPEIGVVGARLLYPGGGVQHAGKFATSRGLNHAFHGCADDAPGPFGLAQLERNVSAVCGACLMIRRQTFNRLSGFDERLAIVGNDDDLCLRCGEAGLRSLITPYATLYHHESVSRVRLPETEDAALFARLWRGQAGRSDPFFNVNLSIEHSDYRAESEFTEIQYSGRAIAAPESIRELLVIKLDYIGDFVLALPALRRLKAHFRGARLTLLASPTVCRLAAAEPAVDATIPFEFFHPQSELGLRELPPPELEALAETLQSHGFDLAVDLRCLTHTRPVLAMSGATWRAGFDPDYRFPWLDIVATAEPDIGRQTKRAHISDTLSDFAERIAASFTLPPPAVPQPTPVAESLGAAPNMRVAIHAAAGNRMKQWPVTSFVEVIDWLVAAFDCDIILIGHSEDSDVARQILENVGDIRRVFSAVGLTALEDLPALLTGCQLFIGNDSGPHHLAASLGVPTIGIHCASVDAHEFGPRGPQAVAVRRHMVCGPCYLSKAEDCPRALACLTGITPEAIFQLAKTMLSSSLPSSLRSAGP